MLAVGSQAPDFTATAHDGSTVRLRDFRGKKVVLWFYQVLDARLRCGAGLRRGVWLTLRL